MAVPTGADETLPAAAEGGPCPFPVLIHVVTNKQYSIEFFDRTITQGNLVLEMTNTVTGTSVIRNVSGPGTFTVADQLLVARGPWFFAFAPGDLVDVLGHVTTEWIFIINRGTFVLRLGDPKSGVPHQLISQTGVQEKLCETLGGDTENSATEGLAVGEPTAGEPAAGDETEIPLGRLP
ncbi:MAG TPA: hypothetical protein VNA32_07005 [Actinomycetota bacterium]|nr:hypothetical protein [Actinomycetota bacterium]